jgi:PAS domain S-box-containing protein
MKTKLRVLIIEDSEDDAILVKRQLEQSGYDPSVERVENAADMNAALSRQPWDLVISDYSVPGFNTLAALSVVRGRQLDVPFIIVSGTIGEETAVAAMKAGAHDYVMKSNLARLAPAVERELREAANRTARREAEWSLRESELRNRRLWENCPDAVLLMDPDGRIDFANPAARRVFNSPQREIAGMNFFQLLPENLPDEQRATMAAYLRAGEGAANWYAREVEGRRRSGTEVILEISFSDLKLNGQRRIVGFVRNITTRKLAERELRKNEQQFAVARDIQQSLFPKSAPVLHGFDIAGASYPAEAAGGDFFDYLPMMNGRWGIILGDVTGHGLGPALLAAETRAFFRVLARNREDLGDIVTRANAILAEDTSIERFVTLMLAQLDPATRSLTYLNAGHPAGYILSAGGEVKTRLSRTGVALGLSAQNRYSAAPVIQLVPGDILLLLTDGVEEAISPDNQIFGAERVLNCLRACRTLPARKIVEQLFNTVRDFEFHSSQNDDITMVVVKIV